LRLGDIKRVALNKHKMKTIIKQFVADNWDEAGILVLVYTLSSYLNLIKNFLLINGWSINHFLLGTFGQLIYILFEYILGKKRKAEGFHTIAKKLTSLFLGGSVAMMVLPALPLGGALMSIIGVGIGFAFQRVWISFIAQHVDKLFPKEEENGDSINKSNEGEDRPNDPPR
jgi:O-antigen/teichoic acid export membrane protein